MQLGAHSRESRDCRKCWELF